jgi:hypothetical protein
MADFIITAPNGQKYKVIGENQQGAYAALQKSFGGSTPQEQPSGFLENAADIAGPTIAAAENLQSEKVDYDVEGALKEGVDVNDIVSYLAAETGYDAVGEKAAGRTNDDIIAHLTDRRQIGKTQATLEGISRGATVGAPALGLGYTGAMMGLPAGLPGFIFGGVLGTFAGAYLGATAEDIFFPEEGVVPGERPFLEGGKTIGAGIVALPAPHLAAAQRPINMVSTDFMKGLIKNMGGDVKALFQPLTPIDRMLRTAQTSPGMFAAAESSALAASGLGGGLSEAVSPGAEYQRMFAELTLGMTNPTRIATASYTTAKSALQKAVGGLTTQGRQRNLGSKILSILENAGEDPNAVLRALTGDDELVKMAAEAGVDLGPRTAAAKSRSNALAMIQRSVAQNSPLGPTVKAAATQNLEGVAKLIDLMIATDDPSLISAAAQMREAAFNEGLTLRLEQAAAQAADTASKIMSRNPEASAEAGKVVEGLIRNVLSEARSQEKMLYRNVDLTEPAEAGGIIAEFAAIKSEILKESPVPSLIQKFVARASGEDVAVEGPAVNAANDALPIIQKSIAKTNEALSEKTLLNPVEAQFLDTYVNARKNGVQDDFAKQSNQIEMDYSNAQRDFTKTRLAALRDELQAQFETRPDLFKNPKAKAIEVTEGSGGYRGSNDYIVEQASNRLKEFGFSAKSIEELFANAGAPSSAAPVKGTPTASRLSTNKLDVAARARASNKDVTNDEVVILQELLQGKLDLPDIGITGGKTVQRLAQLRLKALNEQNKLADIEAQVPTAGLEEVLAGTPADMTLRDLTNFRSEMLDMGRDASGAGNFRDARMYGRMAEAALDDIGLKAGNAEEGIQLTANQKSLQEAHTFSRALNDTFTRAFAGDVLARKKSGAKRLPPELLANSILTGGGDATAFKMAQLEDAATFMAKNAGQDFAESSAAQLGTLRASEETILRLASERTVNPETGQVNTLALARFMKNNAAAMEKFPALKADLEDAVTAQQRLKNVTDANSLEAKALESQKWFKMALGNDETPANIIASVIGEPGLRPENAVKDLKALARLTNQTDARSVAGLKDAILDRAVAYAGGADETFNFGRFRKFLFEPMSRKQPSVIAVMRDTGVMGDAEAARLNRLLQEADKIEAIIAKDGGVTDTNLIDAPAAAVDFVTRLLGANVGSRMGNLLPKWVRGGSGAGMIEASAGVRYTKNMFQEMPRTYFKDMLKQAIMDPEAMAILLNKGRSPKETLKIGRQMNGWLVSTGLAPAIDEVRDLQSRTVIPPQMLDTSAQAADIQSYLDNLRPPVAETAPPPTPRPAPDPAPRPAAPAPQAQPVAQPAPAPTTAESSYSALFPNDMISPMLNARTQQGIGALMPR